MTLRGSSLTVDVRFRCWPARERLAFLSGGVNIQRMSNESEKRSQSPWFEHTSQIKRPILRLFVFPYAGGSVQAFQSWSGYFPVEVDLCLVNLPGHGKRFGERAFVRLTRLVEVLADQIACEIQPPFIFYGHSMGALVSFELARELFRRYGDGPSHLFLSGHGAPHLPKSEPDTFNLPDSEFIANLKRLNGTPLQLLNDPEARQIFLPMLRADFEVVNTYEYRDAQPLLCPLSIYGGLQDMDVPVASLSAWEVHTSATCKVRLFEGDHFFIHDSRSEFVQILRNDVLSGYPSGGFIAG